MEKIKKYLATESSRERLTLLKEFIKLGIAMPIDLSEDLLLLDLGIPEKSLLVEATRADHSRELEAFFLKGVTRWAQDIGVAAVRQWCAKTQHLEKHQWPGILATPSLSQRVFYTIIDRCFETGGTAVITAALEAEGLREMSHAVHGLILLRATQWQVVHPMLKEIAHRAIWDQATYFSTEHRATAAAVGYLAWSEPLHLEEIFRSAQCHEAYRPLIGAVVASLQPQTLTSHWPILWQRKGLKKDQVAQALTASSRLYFPSSAPQDPGNNNDHRPMKNLQIGVPWEPFAGIPAAVLREALLELQDPLIATSSVLMVHGLLNPQDIEPIFQHLEKLSIFQDPMLAALAPEPYRQRSSAPSIPAQTRQNPVDGGRRRFFDLAYRNHTQQDSTQKPSSGAKEDPIWDHLTTLWSNPSESLIQDVAKLSRKKGGIYNICYLNTLGRCKGIDQAVLKVLDFVRSDQEEELKAMIGALSGINTPRSLQELIAALTRPNMTRSLQLEALAHLKQHDLTQVQPNLRSAFADLGVPTDGAGIEVRDLLATTLEVAATITSHVGSTRENQPENAKGGWDQSYDQNLSGIIQGYRDLSSEVKKSLRTSLFFHRQVEQKGAAGLIDLSPVIDMQYKALELLFRESFEEYCSRLINRGNLQRKLDIIGYARPIPQSMDQFENYICSLPTIRDIPFFSKFKLRKMLRAICQFRPGRRFTLDGLKAFALFFLCFGRKQCTYGLAGLIDTGYADDQKLFEFCLSLHIFQDLRNRAAHEGMHPEASSDMDKLWLKTAEIIQSHNLVYEFLARTGEIQMQRGGESPEPPRNPGPKIIKKAS